MYPRVYIGPKHACSLLHADVMMMCVPTTVHYISLICILKRNSARCCCCCWWRRNRLKRFDRARRHHLNRETINKRCVSDEGNTPAGSNKKSSRYRQNLLNNGRDHVSFWRRTRPAACYFLIAWRQLMIQRTHNKWLFISLTDLNPPSCVS